MVLESWHSLCTQFLKAFSDRFSNSWITYGLQSLCIRMSAARKVFTNSAMKSFDTTGNNCCVSLTFLFWSSIGPLADMCFMVALCLSTCWCFSQVTLLMQRIQKSLSFRVTQNSQLNFNSLCHWQNIDLTTKNLPDIYLHWKTTFCYLTFLLPTKRYILLLGSFSVALVISNAYSADFIVNTR